MAVASAIKALSGRVSAAPVMGRWTIPTCCSRDAAVSNRTAWYPTASVVRAAAAAAAAESPSAVPADRTARTASSYERCGLGGSCSCERGTACFDLCGYPFPTAPSPRPSPSTRPHIRIDQ